MLPGVQLFWEGDVCLLRQRLQKMKRNMTSKNQKRDRAAQPRRGNDFSLLFMRQVHEHGLFLPLYSFSPTGSICARMRYLPRGVLFLLLAVALHFVSAAPLAAEQQSTRSTPAAPVLSRTRLVPPIFAQGETLEYMVFLNEIPAGASQIRLQKARQAGREVYHTTAQGYTSELIDYLYRLRGTADGMFTANGFSPLSFRLTYTNNDRQREIGMRYDPATKTLLGTTKKQAQAKERSVPAREVYDPLTAFYLLRSSDLLSDNLFQVEVFTGKERYRVVTHVVGTENVLLTSGIRPAIRLHPAIFSLDANPEENLLPQETSLWVTADATHIPLKLESFLPIGRVVVELNK